MKLIKTLTLNTAVAAVTILGGLAGTAHAAGDANLSVAGGTHSVGSTFNVPVYVNSAEPINVVTAGFSYDGSQLQFLGVGCGSAFGITADSNANSVTCGVNGGGSVSGSQLVASISFKALAGSGSSAVSIASGSHVYSAADNSDVWNGALNSSSVSFYTPAPVAAAVVAPTPPAAPQAKAAPAKRHSEQLTYTTRPATHKGVSAWVYAPVATLVALTGLAYIFRKDVMAWTKTANKQVRKMSFVRG
jgi:Cohesin domain